MNIIIKSFICALLLIFIQLAYTSLKFITFFSDAKVFSSLSFTEVFNSHFSIEAIQFLFVALAIHTLFSFILISCITLLRKSHSIRPFILNILYFSIFCFQVILANSYLFPNSDFTINPDLIIFRLAFLITFLLVLISIDFKKLHILLTNLSGDLCKKIKKGSKKKAVIAFSICALSSLLFLSEPSTVRHKKQNTPNIIILSVDSLRPDITNQLSPEKSPAPFISKQLGLSYNFTRAYTPLARTFPSWMSVLTGKLPKNHKAEFNLTNPKRFKNEVTLAHILQLNNYHTVYASDEKRFANITNALGFSDVLGPPYGLADFLLGNFSDMPLLNFVSLVPYAELILPNSVNNRAAHKIYDPKSFSDYLIRKLENSVENAENKPLFIAIHLCLPHHPFSWRSSNLTESVEENYINTVIEADQQIEHLYKAMQSLNIINEQSIQIFMSDHGESLPKDEKTFVNANGSIQVVAGLGHGSDSRQIKQHHVVLAIQQSSLLAQNDAQLASLIDITPTLLGLVPNLNYPQSNFDGLNILNEDTAKTKERWLSFETGYNVDAIGHSKINESDIFKQAAYAYRITPQGKVVIKDGFYDELLSQKQYAWWNGESLITKTQTKFHNFNWQNSTIESASNLQELEQDLFFD